MNTLITLSRYKYDKTMKYIRSQHGLTLIELMIVVALLAIVTGIAIPAYTGYVESSRMSECINEVAAVKLAQESFFIETRGYFSGATAADQETNSAKAYVPSARFTNGQSDCTLNVTSPAAGQYRIAVTGRNKLQGVDLSTLSYQNF